MPVIQRLLGPEGGRFERVSRIFWTLLLVGAGSAHFWLKDFLVAQMPPYFPFPAELVLLSGIVELALAVTLQIPVLRRWTWAAISLMCVAYLPVHWYVWVECEMLREVNGPYHIPCWLALVRLPVQGVFIAWTAWLAWITWRKPATGKDL